MKNVFCIIVCLIVMFNSTFIGNADEVLPLNFKAIPIDFIALEINGSSTLENGELLCNFYIKNRSRATGYSVPLYVIGRDINGNIVEVKSTTAEIPKCPTKTIKANKYTYEVPDMANSPTIQVTIKLSDGFLIKSLETGIKEKNNENITLHSYWIRKDYEQNKISVTGTVKNNFLHLSENGVAIKRNAGMMAIGYDKSGKIVEVQSAYDNFPNGSEKTFELSLMAVSEIDHVTINITGNSNTELKNVYGSRIESSKYIITGSIENNLDDQYVQVVAKGYSEGKVVDIDGKTIKVAKNANASYRFDMGEHNNIEHVEVEVIRQEQVVCTAELISYFSYIEKNNIIVDAIISNGYNLDKNLGIIVTGLDKDLKVIETNTAVVHIKGNQYELQPVKATLEACDRIKSITVELAGKLEDSIQLKKCAYRVENDTYLVTSIIENGNTVEQKTGVKVTGYDAKGKVVEVTGYCDSIPANTTKQYKSILTNTKYIKRVEAELIGFTDGKDKEIHAIYNNSGFSVVSGVLINSDTPNKSGFIAIAKDDKGKVIDIDCFYSSLSENSVTPFLLKLNNTKMNRIETFTIQADKLNPALVLNGAGYYKGTDSGYVNAIITNGTNMKQISGIVSIAYNSKGKAIDMNVSKPVTLEPNTLNKIQNLLSNKKEIVSVKSFLYGTKCSTCILATSYDTESDNKSGKYALCITNGAADQKFKIIYSQYDTKGRKLNDINYSIFIPKYGVGVLKVRVNTINISKGYVKVYDSTNKKVTGKGILDLVYSK